MNCAILILVFICLKKKIKDGKYMVLPSGELHIRDVSPEDGYKSYRCRTKHRLTGETRLSATAGRLVVTGELPHSACQILINSKVFIQSACSSSTKIELLDANCAALPECWD